jgi:pyrimidine-nucleoside phosphorylase
MNVPALIERKRDGGTLADDEIRGLVAAFTAGTVPDYQMAALLMAIVFRGMDERETATLTRAMLESGDRFTWPAGTPPKIDKHSTGGIGDKTSLVLAPLLACHGFWVPMISGRGLGITGGTLDKLESIPGFSVAIDPPRALAQLERIGAVMMGQTASLCPADRKLYALRDVTGTVPSVPLIVGSIMSKKLAESLDRLVLDVKFGRGAFMKTRSEAETLAAALCRTGEAMGVATRALLTPMDEPLGRCVGNALEVAEALEVLRGGGPADLVALTLDLAEAASALPRATLAASLRNGLAFDRFAAMVEAQGGDPACLNDFPRVHPAPVARAVPAPRGGILAGLDAAVVGRAALELGAGRRAAGDRVDFRVGFSALAKSGGCLAPGAPLGIVHAADQIAAARAAAELVRAAAWQDESETG